MNPLLFRIIPCPFHSNTYKYNLMRMTTETFVLCAHLHGHAEASTCMQLIGLRSGGLSDSPSDSGGAAVNHSSELAHAFSSDLSARLWDEIIDDGLDWA